IRLAHLLPAQSWEEDISCNLHTVSLDDTNPIYEALSYVWGDPKRTLPVLLNGHTFEVTTSLESALRRLRHPTSTRTIWVDALCINQKNDAERTEQVKLMRYIYSQTQEVLIWLGE
ncbi:hypothetical protein EJ08DRAFT_552229, partial [Tothia fuscella]